VLDEKARSWPGGPVTMEEDSYYDLPTARRNRRRSTSIASAPIKHGLRFGEHGLPLMGTGDWNDGMNLVGEQGKGESVWLAFFLHDVLTQFIPIANRNRTRRLRSAARWRRRRCEHLEEHGWDGEWYRRAYFDDGRPLGSAVNPECRIDSLPQSWSVLSGGVWRSAADGDGETGRASGQSGFAGDSVVRAAADQSDLQPGYVKGYPPGVRENGGQYTHAAVWAVMAFAKSGDGERAWELFNMINPIRHGDSEAAIRRYKVEPYVVAADVYTNLQHAGRGGWTWYTGSAGWMYRLILNRCWACDWKGITCGSRRWCRRRGNHSRFTTGIGRRTITFMCAIMGSRGHFKIGGFLRGGHAPDFSIDPRLGLAL
jgi:cyclic beta-1,2-glucan synthetase